MSAAVDQGKLRRAMAVQASALLQALQLLPPRMDTRAARVQVLSMGLQESDFLARVQVVDGGGKGPARGLWQFERFGGVRGVLLHPATEALAQAVCKACRVPGEIGVVWAELERNDVLAAAFARLFLFTDPGPLPAVGDAQAAWACYERTWRPGKPHPARWPANYAAALAAVPA